MGLGTALTTEVPPRVGASPEPGKKVPVSVSTSPCPNRLPTCCASGRRGSTALNSRTAATTAQILLQQRTQSTWHCAEAPSVHDLLLFTNALLLFVNALLKKISQECHTPADPSAIDSYIDSYCPMTLWPTKGCSTSLITSFETQALKHHSKPPDLRAPGAKKSVAHNVTSWVQVCCC